MCKKSLTTSNYFGETIIFEECKLYDADFEYNMGTVFITTDMGNIQYFETKDDKIFELMFSDYFYTEVETRKMKLNSII